LAYDENRNLIRDDNGQPQTETRDPLPEVLHGNPDRTRDLIDASWNKWSFTAGCELALDSPTDALELSEGRRREAETELEAREVEMDREMTH